MEVTFLHEFRVAFTIQKATIEIIFFGFKGKKTNKIHGKCKALNFERMDYLTITLLFSRNEKA